MDEWGNIIEVAGKKPEIDETAYVDPSAVIIGDVVIEAGVGIFPGCVLRAEDEQIMVRRNAVILDMSFLEAPKDSPVIIGEAALLSHRITLHGAQIGPSSLVGIGTILLDRATVGRECIVSAGSLVPPRKEIEDRSLVIGSPVKFKRKLETADVMRINAHHEEAWEKARIYGAKYGAAPMEKMVSGLGTVKVDGEIFADTPDKLTRKMGQQFDGIDFKDERPY